MSTQHDRLDPESRSALEVFLGALPGGFNGIPDIVARREASAALNAADVEAAGGPDPSVTRDDRTVPGLDGDPEVHVNGVKVEPAAALLPGTSQSATDTDNRLKPRMPFTVNITNAVRPGENVLSVRVDHARITELSLGGILRPVVLIQFPESKSGHAN